MAVVAILVVALAGGLQPASSPVPLPGGAHPGDSPGEQGCTSFCLDNGGYCVFGANYDNTIQEGILYVNKRGVSKVSWDRSTSGEVARWTSQYGSFTFNMVGYQHPWGGMNEAGLMISTMALQATAPPAADGRPPLETAIWIQYQLDKSRTVEEVIASEAVVRLDSPLGGCCHYLVCDAKGDCAVIEQLERRTVHYAAETLPVQALTNSTYEESLSAWRDGNLSDNSLVRFAVAADAVEGYRPGDDKAAIEVAFDTLARASSADWTVWSFVLDPVGLQVHFRTKDNETIRSIDFDKLDFACGTPVQMLDVHARLEGDISKGFETYSHEPSLEHMAAVLNELGFGSPRDEIDSWLQEMEGFPCADGRAHIETGTPEGQPPFWLILAALIIVVPLAYRSLVRGREGRTTD
jgi:choloylglycine hydrolase